MPTICRPQPLGGTWSVKRTFDASIDPSTTYTTDVSPLPGIGSAYLFDGNGGATINALSTLPTDPTRDSASFELWLRPSDLTSQDVILDIGGAQEGLSLTLDGDQLQFTLTSVFNTTSNVGAQTSYRLTPTDDFIHVVASLDIDRQLTNGVEQVFTNLLLHVNGAEVARYDRLNGLGVWSDASSMGLGTAVGDIGGKRHDNFSGFGNFHGEIAEFRFYDRLLTTAEIVGVYQSVTAGGVIYDPRSGSPLVGNEFYADPTGASQRTIVLLDHSDTTNPSLYGNDVITGGGDNDTLFGGLGDDTIHGDGQSNTSLDGNDYVEGGGGNDFITGGLGQDDLIGGSSSLYGLGATSQRPDGQDTLFGGSGAAAARKDAGDLSTTGHANDADVIVGDNADIYVLLDSDGSYLRYAYDDYDAVGKRIPRAVLPLDYQAGDNADGSADVGDADLIRGGAGDDQIFGLTGNDVLFGDGQDDDLIGGDGSDRIYGGSGIDGIAGDNGVILTSRNGVAEYLSGQPHGNVVTEFALSDGQTGAYEYLSGQLTKSFVAIAWEDGGSDVIYGGLGDDFVHAGAGDDAVSGSEALAEFYDDAPQLDDDTLRYNSETRYFEQYDPAAPLARVPGFFLNFEAIDIGGNVIEDGKDRLFGGNGNDWIVGGTGKDRLFGGLGDDLLNADDNLDTGGGANDIAEATGLAHPDFVYGGGGLDVLIANTGADRLMDWRGDFNVYVTPFSRTGPTIMDWPSEELVQFVKDLGRSSGADQSLAEPDGELGLFTQTDDPWSDNGTYTPQPILPGVSADTLGGGEDDRSLTPTFDGSTPGNVTFVVLQGTASNADLYGTTVWLDLDRDGQLDAQEPQGIANIEGVYQLNVPANLDYQNAVIRTLGGIDVGTGLPVVTSLAASPVHDVNITPLTTLVHYLTDLGLGRTAANTLTQAAFHLSSSIDIGNFDHFEESRKLTSDVDGFISTLTNFHRLAIHLHHLVAELTQVSLESAPIRAAISDVVFAAMAEQLYYEDLQLDDPVDLRQVIGRILHTLTASGASSGLPQPTTVPSDQVLDGVSQILASGSDRLELLVDQASDGHELIRAINRLKKHSQGQELTDLKAAISGTLAIEVAIERHGDLDAELIADIQSTLLPPHMTHLPDFTIHEDQTMAGFEFRLFDFETAFDDVTVRAYSDNPSLLPDDGILFSPGSDVQHEVIRLIPAANQHGVANVTVIVADQDGMSLAQEFVLTVLPVNDAPSFTLVSDALFVDNLGSVSVQWLATYSVGSEDEQQLGQDVTFDITVRDEDRNLFLVLPTLDVQTGLLSFTPNPNVVGVASVVVTIQDGSGGLRGGIDRASQTFEIRTFAEEVSVQIIDVNPDPRTVSVGEIQIQFSRPVQGFDLSDLTLRRDGGSDLLAGSSASLTSVDGINWILGNLESLTEAGGRYRLELDAANAAVSGASGQRLTENAVEVWHNNSDENHVISQYDVNRSGEVTPLDALLVINYLNRGWSSTDYNLDVNNSGAITSLDALLVINVINALTRTFVAGEGELTTQWSPMTSSEAPGRNMIGHNVTRSLDSMQRVDVAEIEDSERSDASPPIHHFGPRKAVVQRSRLSNGPFVANAKQDYEWDPIDWAIDEIAIDVAEQQSNSWFDF